MSSFSKDLLKQIKQNLFGRSESGLNIRIKLIQPVELGFHLRQPLFLLQSKQQGSQATSIHFWSNAF